MKININLIQLHVNLILILNFLQKKKWKDIGLLGIQVFSIIKLRGWPVGEKNNLMKWNNDEKNDIYVVLIQIDRKSMRAMSNDYLPNKNRNTLWDIYLMPTRVLFGRWISGFDVAFNQKPRLNTDIAERNQTFYT